MKNLKTKLKSILKKTQIDGIQKVVVGAIVTLNGEILLVKRNNNDFMGGLVELPSGGIDNNEHILDALQRELLEETGLTVTRVIKYIDSFNYTSGSGKKARQLNFLVEVDHNEVKLNPDEHTQHYWVHPNESILNNFNISKQTKETILKSQKNT